ncbi:hypothetical protein TSOC_012772 [Tetrabaena socialis]|uniref:Peptidase S74 domain-containing protein n=1 Tax=Tetrabaena socialis TaxID=47790 RepID=A0A2J7ZM67_9CHLO|nr:hypothetical protein TSOC_012772 [Tetrabaena socialis]|eukprot:PNH01352.1 hypothetical protein TSOC_012772 [Tetrabaena socialis]
MSSSLNFTNGVILASSNDSVSAPAHSWQGSSSTGMYLPSSNQIGFAIAGSNKLQISSNTVMLGKSIDNNYTSNVYTMLTKNNCSVALNSSALSNLYGENLIIGNGAVTGKYWSTSPNFQYPTVTGGDTTIRGGSISLNGNNGASYVKGIGGSIRFMPGYAYVSTDVAGNSRNVQGGQIEFLYANTIGTSLDTGYTQGMVMTYNGRVGINNSNPAAQLDVTGTVNASVITTSNDSVSAPGHSWDFDTNTGMYNQIGNQIGFTTAGSNRLTIDSNGLTLGRSRAFFGTSNDSVRAPSFSWSGDSNTGMYQPNSNQIGFSTNGVNSLFLNSNGQVGINTTSPSSQHMLDVIGNVKMGCVLGTLNNMTFQTLSNTLRIITDLASTGSVLSFSGSNNASGKIIISATRNGSNWTNYLEEFDVNYICNGDSNDVQVPTIVSSKQSQRLQSASSDRVQTSIYHDSNANTFSLRTTRGSSTTFTIGYILQGNFPAPAVTTEATASPGTLITNYGMCMASNGNTGLGTNAPSVPLHVTGTAWADSFGALSNDSVTAPGYSWQGDSDTGMYHPNSNQIGFATSGSNRLFLNSNGTIGIGTMTPQYTLDIVGGLNVTTLQIGGTAVTTSQIVSTSNVAYNTSNAALTASNAAIAASNTAISASNIAVAASNAAFATSNIAFTSSNAAFTASNAAVAASNAAFATSNVAFTASNAAVSASNIAVAASNAAFFSSNALSNAARLTGNNLSLATGVILASSNDTVTAPGYSWQGSSRTGMYLPGSNQIGIATAGSNRLFLNSNGNIGIGTLNPQYTLDIAGGMNATTLQIGGTAVTSSQIVSTSNVAFATSNAAFTASNTATSASNAAISASNIAVAASNAAFATSNAAFTASNTATSASNAAISASNIAVAASNAAFATSNAAFTASNAATSASNAAISASNIAVAASNAAFATSNAAFTASNAATSASNAAISASNIAVAASNAAFATSNAAFTASNAATSASNAAISASNIAVAASTAAFATSNAAFTASNAATSASNAAISASNIAAATSASNAAISASNIAVAASNAAFATSNAAFTASNAATSASNAAISASNIAVAASNAAFATSNTAFTASNAATSASNAAISASNIAVAASNAAFATSHAAFTASNTATSASHASVAPSNIAVAASNAAFATSNAAFTASNAATSASNTAISASNIAVAASNAVFATSNAAFTASNAATSASNAAFATSNVAFYSSNALSNAVKLTGANLSLATGVILASSNGTVAAPGYSWQGNSNTGMYQPNSNQIGFTTAGSNRLFLNSNGTIGIGTTSVAANTKVHINCTESNGLLITNSTARATVSLKYGTFSNFNVQQHFDGAAILDNTNITGDLRFYTGCNYEWYNRSNGTGMMTLTNTAYLGVGTLTPAMRMDVYQSMCNVNVITDTGRISFTDLGGVGETGCRFATKVAPNDYRPLTCYNNGAEVLTVRNSNLGVGISNPLFPLDVYRGMFGITGDTGRVFCLDTSIAETGCRFATKNAGNDFRSLTCMYNGGEVMTMRGSNLGIGISNPGNTIDVFQNSTSAIVGQSTGRIFCTDATVGSTVGETGCRFGTKMGTYNYKSMSVYFDGNEVMTSRNGNLGLGTTAPNYQLELSLDNAGKPSSSTWTVTSDERVKQDIEVADLDRCYDIIKNLDLKRYTWDSNYLDATAVADRSKLGWIAQDVETVFPKAVDTIERYGFSNFKTLNVDQIYAALYGSVKKLQQVTESLQLQVADLQAQLAAK